MNWFAPTASRVSLAITTNGRSSTVCDGKYRRWCGKQRRGRAVSCRTTPRNGCVISPAGCLVRQRRSRARIQYTAGNLAIRSGPEDAGNEFSVSVLQHLFQRPYAYTNCRRPSTGRSARIPRIQQHREHPVGLQGPDQSRVCRTTARQRPAIELRNLRNAQSQLSRHVPRWLSRCHRLRQLCNTFPTMDSIA